MSQSILVVEDDESLQLVLRDNLLDAKYEVSTASTGEQAKRLINEHKFDLIILDIMLPDTDGYTLCRFFRNNGISAMILMLTARSLEDDIVKGFSAGADDYLIKPYRLRELLMRVRALLRRQSTSPQLEIRLPGFTIESDARKISASSGEDVLLTKKEFELLEYLILNRNRALTRTQILDQVWGNKVIVEERTVDNFISNLKKKLNWNVDSKFRLASIRGIGYRFELDDD